MLGCYHAAGCSFLSGQQFYYYRALSFAAGTYETRPNATLQQLAAACLSSATCLGFTYPEGALKGSVAKLITWQVVSPPTDGSSCIGGFFYKRTPELGTGAVVVVAYELRGLTKRSTFSEGSVVSVEA